MADADVNVAVDMEDVLGFQFSKSEILSDFWTLLCELITCFKSGSEFTLAQIYSTLDEITDRLLSPASSVAVSCLHARTDLRVHSIQIGCELITCFQCSSELPHAVAHSHRSTVHSIQIGSSPISSHASSVVQQ